MVSQLAARSSTIVYWIVRISELIIVHQNNRTVGRSRPFPKIVFFLFRDGPREGARHAQVFLAARLVHLVPRLPASHATTNILSTALPRVFHARRVISSRQRVVCFIITGPSARACCKLLYYYDRRPRSSVLNPANGRGVGGGGRPRPRGGSASGSAFPFAGKSAFFRFGLTSFFFFSVQIPSECTDFTIVFFFFFQ